MTDDIKTIYAALRAIDAEVEALVNGKRWSLSVPAQPFKDSDLIITANTGKALAALSRIEAQAKKLQDDNLNLLQHLSIETMGAPLDLAAQAEPPEGARFRNGMFVDIVKYVQGKINWATDSGFVQAAEHMEDILQVLVKNQSLPLATPPAAAQSARELDDAYNFACDLVGWTAPIVEMARRIRDRDKRLAAQPHGDAEELRGLLTEAYEMLIASPEPESGKDRALKHQWIRTYRRYLYARAALLSSPLKPKTVPRAMLDELMRNAVRAYAKIKLGDERPVDKVLASYGFEMSDE